MLSSSFPGKQWQRNWILRDMKPDSEIPMTALQGARVKGKQRS